MNLQSVPAMRQLLMHHVSSRSLRAVSAVASFAVFGISIPAALAADAELTNYRTGIDVTYSGTKGTDYMEEYFYHDKLISDRKVVYIKSTTKINMAHNERNVARSTTSYYTPIGANGKDGVPNSGDEGVIRYRVDGDLHWGPRWTAGQGGTPNPEYTGPLTFASLKYPNGAAGTNVSVLGKTGNNGVSVTNKSAYFTYGHIDPFGDEWHTIQVADDDWFSSTDTEWRASDGRVHHFVVNPKTPALTVRAGTGGEFYTTPPKVYFIPKIHAQTTYFSGAVTFELKALGGETVHYRINNAANGQNGTWHQAVNPRIDGSAFTDGDNTLEYYYNSSYKKVRKVVKNPGFPSSGETHGYLLVGDEANYKSMLRRRQFEPYKYHWDNILKDGGRTSFDQNFHQGLRYVQSLALMNAVTAKIMGVNAKQAGRTKSYSLYAKQMLLENLRNIDNVGFEMNHSQMTLPTREITYRGYYDVGPTLVMAYAYDLLISFFKASPETPDGITPIEDYFIRDALANNIVECLMFSGSFQGDTVLFDRGGMWDVARKCGAVVGMFAIPSYSTPYYGTNGLQGSSTGYTHTPFLGQALTWKQALIDTNTPMTGYPNLANRLGIDEYNCTADGTFTDRVVYAGLNGYVYYHVLNVFKSHYPQKTFPHAEAFFLRATKGEMTGLKDTAADASAGPRRFVFLPMYNKHFPVIADAGFGIVKGRTTTDPLSENQAINGNMPYALAWYGIAPKAPSNPHVAAQ